jgi:hypothetical protein
MTMPDAPGPVTLGPLACTLTDEGLRWLTFAGTEVVRGVSFPIRDEGWGTHPLKVLTRTLDRGDGQMTFTAGLQTADGAFDVAFSAVLELAGNSALATLAVTITARRAAIVNRAGFTILHPIRGVAGAPMTVTRPDGSAAEVALPLRISPGQPVLDIAGLAHRVGAVAVDIAIEGEVFEMEDQRNWSDASFKTYCRPLARPRPFPVAAGEVIAQRLRIRLTQGAPVAATAAAAAPRAVMPEVALAMEPGLSALTAPPDLAALRRIARLRTDAADADLAALTQGSGPLTLELAVQGPADLAAFATRAAAAGLRPDRVAAIPAPYLRSYQPEGPWPSPTPSDLIAPARAAFPAAAIGTGVFTNFTELNRCPPATADFVTFGGTAIVHAADDASVIETLEAWPDICASAHALAGRAPLHLGLVSIGMRSNPYGKAVAPNPQRQRLAMALDDPRQDGPFAAAWATGLLAALAEGGAASVALAMPDGPLGAAGPLRAVLAHAAGLAGGHATVSRHGGLVILGTPKGGLAANLGPAPAPHGLHRGRLADGSPMPADLPPLGTILFDATPA